MNINQGFPYINYKKNSTVISALKENLARLSVCNKSSYSDKGDQEGFPEEEGSPLHSNVLFALLL